MRETMDRKSEAEGRNVSRLPEFTPEWVAKVQGSHDFLGLNHYSTELITERISTVPGKPLFSSDISKNIMSF